MVAVRAIPYHRSTSIEVREIITERIARPVPCDLDDKDSRFRVIFAAAGCEGRSLKRIGETRWCNIETIAKREVQETAETGRNPARMARYRARHACCKGSINHVGCPPREAPERKHPMKCANHQDRPGTYYCAKYNRYLCDECIQCSDPTLFCKHRTSCLIWEVVRHGSPDEQAAADRGACGRRCACDEGSATSCPK
jgi:hypothetical protein